MKAYFGGKDFLGLFSVLMLPCIRVCVCECVCVSVCVCLTTEGRDPERNGPRAAN